MTAIVAFCESRITFPCGTVCTSNGKYPDGWSPCSVETYLFWKKRDMLAHVAHTGTRYECRATILQAVAV